MILYNSIAYGERILPSNLPNEKTYNKISEWLIEYHSTEELRKKMKCKARIVAQMIPVVKKIARTIARRANDPIDDLVQAGCIGLLKAIDNFSPEKNDNFKVYAGYLIIGEMKHYLRDKLNTIRVPRHIQELCIRINNFTQTLTAEEVDQLTSDDVAYALQIPTKSVDFAMQIDRRRATISLEEVYKSENNKTLSYEEILSDNNFKEASEYEDARIIFDEILGQLPDEEKVLVDMYYKLDMSQKEIAVALQITQMGVSRKLRKAFNTIAEIMAQKEMSRLDKEKAGDN